MDQYADLHIHTTASDGRQEIEEVFEKAAQSHLKAIAITDHDTVQALVNAGPDPGPDGLEVISGVELSATEADKDIHILGYYFDTENRMLRDKLEQCKQGRYDRARAIVEKLNGLGLDLKFQTVLRHAGEAAIGRVHIAEAMVEEELVYTFEEAFAKYISYDGPAYAPKLEISVAESIALIHNAGGAAILAHPGTLQEDDDFILQLIGQGLDGIEAFHPDNNQERTRHYLEMARTRGLLVTGGSDSHGISRKKSVIGGCTLPYRYVQKLRAFVNKKRGKEPVT